MFGKFVGWNEEENKFLLEYCSLPDLLGYLLTDVVNKAFNDSVKHHTQWAPWWGLIEVQWKTNNMRRERDRVQKYFFEFLV